MCVVRFSMLSLFLIAFTLTPGVNAQTADRSGVQTAGQPSASQLGADGSLILAPSPEDQAKYQGFLKQPDSGLCKVVPREKYKNEIPVRGGGSNYSFVRLTHEYGFGSEIGFEDGKLYTSFGDDDLGLISSIGDVPIEEVDLNNPAANFLAYYTVPQAEPDARAESRRISDGIEGGGLVFRPMADATVNTTYVMRAVEYGRADVLAVFRVVGQDTDGSLTILWRILQRFPTPMLINPDQM
ncbi:MAG TPA: hypothetical protein VJX67_08185 [Blastocatellia bacterium]|nr:hypothetical protein [Blastocatellia bacterium]